jgi:Zn-dependent peptidase ImmA (M78 family)
MMVDMSEVSWLTKDQISQETDELLNQWAIFTEQEVKPPVPVEAISEKYLEFTLEYDNLDEILGISGVLGATWAEGKRMVINNSLLEGVEGRITFTCGHEIGHWILHRKYLFDQFVRLRDPGKSDQPTVVCRMSASKLRGEWQADYFSSCLLMPQEKVEEAYKRAFGSTPILIYNEKSCFGRNNPVVIDPALDTTKEIAQKVITEGNFTNVSKEAMCYRLNDLGLLVNLTGKPLVGQFKAIKRSPQSL